ncbi:MAG: hypothetical protein ACLR8Y_14260 [Alistipes indistinctus]
MQRQLPPMPVKYATDKSDSPRPNSTTRKSNTEVPGFTASSRSTYAHSTTPDAQIGIDTYNARTERGFTVGGRTDRWPPCSG